MESITDFECVDDLRALKAVASYGHRMNVAINWPSRVGTTTRGKCSTERSELLHNSNMYDVPIERKLEMPYE
jgi:hypothetical protein